MSERRNPVRVLHVDDEPDLTEVVAVHLQREDERFEVEAARSASEGLDRLADGEFDCVVSDYDMPGRNGIEFLEAVREENPDLPFILYTGKGSEEVAIEAISAGITDYLQKGTGTDQYTVLANRVANAVEKWRAEKEADQTRARLEAITENSNDAILTIDSESTIRFANRAVEDLFGYGRDTLVGESLTRLIPPRYRDAHLDAIDRHVETGERTLDWTAVEFPARHQDGHEIPVSVSFSEFERDGERRFVGNLRDISNRVRTEEKLREREERFRQIAENIEEIVWMSDPRKEEMIYVNPAYEDVWERPVESLYEDPVSFLDAVRPEDRDRVEGALDAQATGEYDEEYRIVRPDGETRWIYDRAVPVRNDAGEVYRIVGIASDITERKDRLETIRELQQQAQNLIRAETTEAVARAAVEIAKGTLGLPLSGVHLVTDDADVLEPVAVTDDVREYFGDPPRYDRTTPTRSVDEFNWSVFEEGDPVVIDDIRNFDPIDAAETPTQSGIAYPLGDHGIFITSSAEPNAFDETDRYLVELLATVLTAVLDRSERETKLQTQKQRLQAERDRLHEFTGIVSHDLRNPLNVAEGRLELAREECNSEHLDAVARAHDRMEALIEDLLSLARDGEEVTDPEPVDLAGLVDSCWRNVETADATLLASTDRAIRADPSRLAQLLENLIRNAVEHGGREVTITVGELDDGFYVADDGPGIPADKRKQVFESGYTTSDDGTGFGLAIVQEIVEAHDWAIRATESETAGARFEITGVEFVAK